MLGNSLGKRWIKMNNLFRRACLTRELGQGSGVLRLILASTSPRRADLLRESGISFHVERPEVEEWAAADFPEVSPGDLARVNARRKAKAVADEAVAKATAKAVTVVGKAKGTALAGSSEAAARRSAGMRVRLV